MPEKTLHAFADHRLATVDEAGDARAVIDGDGGNDGDVSLVGLREIRGVGEDVEALAGHPRDRGARVEPPREGDADASTLRRKRAMDARHGKAP